MPFLSLSTLSDLYDGLRALSPKIALVVGIAGAGWGAKSIIEDNHQLHVRVDRLDSVTVQIDDNTVHRKELTDAINGFRADLVPIRAAAESANTRISQYICDQGGRPHRYCR